MSDEPYKPCCEVFDNICGAWSWMQLGDDPEPDIYLMPNIQSGGTKWRVNHCPACGANITGIEIPVEVVWQSREAMGQ